MVAEDLAGAAEDSAAGLAGLAAVPAEAAAPAADGDL